MLRFKVIVPSYGSPDWLETCLASIAWQLYSNYAVCVIDDASGSECSQKIIKRYCQRYGWQGIYNSERKGALHNIVCGIDALECVDTDIIMIIDGDDCLASESVFQRIADEYESEDIYLTYGQYIAWPNNEYGSGATVPRQVLLERNFREIPWIFSHPHTFKYFVWRNIRDEDLRDPRTGGYWRVCYDRAVMYPLLEMSGSKIQYIPDILYVYNRGNPSCVAQVEREEQTLNCRLICAQEKYALLSSE